MFQKSVYLVQRTTLFCSIYSTMPNNTNQQIYEHDTWRIHFCYIIQVLDFCLKHFFAHQSEQDYSQILINPLCSSYRYHLQGEHYKHSVLPLVQENHLHHKITHTFHRHFQSKSVLSEILPYFPAE